MRRMGKVDEWDGANILGQDDHCGNHRKECKDSRQHHDASSQGWCLNLVSFGIVGFQMSGVEEEQCLSKIWSWQSWHMNDATSPYNNLIFFGMSCANLSMSNCLATFFIIAWAWRHQGSRLLWLKNNALENDATFLSLEIYAKSQGPLFSIVLVLLKRTLAGLMRLSRLIQVQQATVLCTSILCTLACSDAPLRHGMLLEVLQGRLSYCCWCAWLTCPW